jgi:hypothetical protein
MADPLCQGGRVGPALKLLDGKGKTVTVKWKSTTHHIKHWDVISNQPRGNLSSMKEDLCAKMAEFHRVLDSSALNCREAWTLYFAVYLPSIGYPLLLCRFSRFNKSELDNLHHKVLGKMIAQDYLWSGDLGGTCFRHLYGEQGTGQVLFFL